MEPYNDIRSSCFQPIHTKTETRILYQVHHGREVRDGVLRQVQVAQVMQVKDVFRNFSYLVVLGLKVLQIPQFTDGVWENFDLEGEKEK